MSNDQFFQRKPTGALYYKTEIPNKQYSVEPGYYSVGVDREGPYIVPQPPPQGDAAVALQEGPFQDVIKDLNQFWSEKTRAAFERYKMLYRRGILLHGKPGTGKSVLFREIARDVVENRQGIVFWNPRPVVIASHVQLLTERLPKGTQCPNILVIFEELEEHVWDDEDSLLQLLDGYQSIHGAVYLASTNHLKEIPNRLKNRPSRFARVVEVQYPTAAARKEFFEKRIHPDDLKRLGTKGLTKMVEKTAELSIDHLKEVIVSVFCMGLTVTQAVTQMKNLKSNETEDES